MKNQRNKFPLEPNVNWYRLPEEVEALVKVVENLETIVDDIETGGTGSQDLQEVTDEGNSTTNNIELLDTAKVTFDNGSRLQKGTTNSYNGGNGGIAQVCSIDYELKWEAGRQYVLQQDGFTIREVKYNFTLTPGVNDDSTRGFVPDSRWILDNGDIYLCTDNTEGAAVWELISTTIPKYKYKVYTALLTRTGATAPTAIVLENTLGTITFGYTTVGTYQINSAYLFIADKTVVFTQQEPSGAFGRVLAAGRTTSTQIALSQTTSSGNSNDDWVTPVSIEIRVYN
jgi:hypothetical protein